MKKILCRTDEPFKWQKVGFGIEMNYSPEYWLDPYMSIVLTCCHQGKNRDIDLSSRCFNEKELISNIDNMIKDLNKLKSQIARKSFRKKVEKIKVCWQKARDKKMMKGIL